MKNKTITTNMIERKIVLIRGQKVMLDVDLAVLYAVPTKSINLAVRRNRIRFPVDFMFQLTEMEARNLRFQIETSSWGGRRYRPFVFTEQGVAMLSSILRSKRAAIVNIAIMRTFVRIREFMMTHKNLARTIEKIEEKIRKHSSHFSIHDQQIKNLFESVWSLLNPPEKPRRQIGFKK